MEENILFYKRLQKQKNGLVELLSQEAAFSKMPEDWFVFVVDIENSTSAVQEGKHQEVNLCATGSIVTVLNEIRKINKKIRVPYFFGGDGTTFIIPAQFHEKVYSILENYRHHVKFKTSLVLRVGYLKVAEIYKLNHKINIAKFALTEHLTIPIVLGNGLKYAEEVIKSSFVNTQKKESELDKVALIGMECRWQEIKPKEDKEKVICLLVNCHLEQNQGAIYKDIFEKINEIFGDYQERNPISNDRLRLNSSIKKMKGELRLKYDNYSFGMLLKSWISTIIGDFGFRVLSTKIEYFRNIPLLADTIMMDGVLHTVFSGTEKKINQFMPYIEALEQQGIIKYGIQITHSTIMSCYVEDRQNNHIHFVDGTEGGYTRAAMMYKLKRTENNRI